MEICMKITVLHLPEHFSIIAEAVVRAVHIKAGTRVKKRTPVLPSQAPSIPVIHDIAQIMDQKHADHQHGTGIRVRS